MNLLVRLVWYLEFQCHFASVVAGDNHRQLASDYSPGCGGAEFGATEDKSI